VESLPQRRSGVSKGGRRGKLGDERRLPVTRLPLTENRVHARSVGGESGVKIGAKSIDG